MFNINFADDWIWTVDQHDHHHGPCSTPLKCLAGSLGQDEYFRIERKRKICKRWRMRQIKKEPSHLPDQQKSHTGSGCGSVGRAVASNTRGPRFESSHRQNLYWTLFTVSCQEKTKIKKKRPGMAHLKKSHTSALKHSYKWGTWKDKWYHHPWLWNISAFCTLDMSSHLGDDNSLLYPSIHTFSWFQ